MRTPILLSVLVLGTAAPLRGQAAITRVSVASGGSQANGPSSESIQSISADGRYVAFVSAATNLVAGDTNGKKDVFVRNVGAGTTDRVSVSSTGVQGDGDCFWPALSSGGSAVTYFSTSTDLVPHDVDGKTSVFRFERDGRKTRLLSERNGGPVADGDSVDVSISADGACVAFESIASDLVFGDNNTTIDVFVWDRTADQLAARSNYGAGWPGANGVPSTDTDVDPQLGSTIQLGAANSSGAATSGALLIGFAPESRPSPFVGGRGATRCVRLRGVPGS